MYFCSGKGIPDILFQQNFRGSQISSTEIPLGHQVVQEYSQLGGTITEFSPFGSDPLNNNREAAEERDRDFLAEFNSFNSIANAIANHNEAFF